MTGERVDVLRLGYRLGRDPRITTHLALVGRALGADRFLLAGDKDPKMFENHVSQINKGTIYTTTHKSLIVLQ